MDLKVSIKRRLARVVSVLAVAILLGHVVQTLSETPPDLPTSAVTPAATPAPKSIVAVAAGPQEAALPTSTASALSLPSLNMSAQAETAPAIIKATTTPLQAASTEPVQTPVPALAVTEPPAALSAPAQPQVMLATQGTDVPATPSIAVPAPGQPEIVSATEPEPSIVPKTMADLMAPEASCNNAMDLSVVATTMIEVALLAPCHPNERIVLRHGPMAITAKTTADGSAFLKIPALDTAGEVSLRFADATEIKGAVSVPEMADLRRFAVQWLDRDTFGVNAFEAGAGYNDPGHISAANPGNLPLTGQIGGGYLMILGDTQATPPMLAEVYTYPKDAVMPVEISIEAVVTTETCGRELLGEVIISDGGSPTVSDLVLAMPDCSAFGDILVLKNPVPDLTLAAAN